MSRDKQNDEMRYLADEMGKAISTELEKRYLADDRKLEEVLKANGWCKASDLAEEIFAEIEEIFNKRIAFYTDMAKQSKFTEKHYAETMIKNCKIYLQEIAELKKKYIGKDTNVTTNTEEGK